MYLIASARWDDGASIHGAVVFRSRVVELQLEFEVEVEAEE
jgi:hypothetical protein